MLLPLFVLLSSRSERVVTGDAEAESRFDGVFERAAAPTGVRVDARDSGKGTVRGEARATA